MALIFEPRSAFDAQTISAFAAAGAALVAATVAGIQFFVGRKQADAALASANAAMKNAEAAMKNAEIATKNAERVGRHAIAAFRQKWIDTLRDTVAEHHSILMSVSEYPYPPEDDRKLSALGTKIELLLNPTESFSDDLLGIIAKIYDCSDVDKRVAMDPEFVAAARAILKAEWEKVKAELLA